MPSIWMGIMLVLLIIEFISMELYGACGAIGALAGLIAYVFDVPLFAQIGIAVLVAVFLVAAVRPIGMKYIYRIKKASRIQDLVGMDAIVVCAVDNSQGVGVVSINGRQWSARSHRPNAVIPAGQVVTVVAMNKDTAIVDDNRRNRR